MSSSKKKSSYFVLDAHNSKRMLLYSLPDPNDEEWWIEGRPFTTKPIEPVVATIIPGCEGGELLPYFSEAQLISDAFYEALLEAGVDNIEVYDAMIRSEDGSIKRRGYKAMNIVGLVRAADLSQTVFSPDNLGLPVFSGHSVKQPFVI